MLVFFSRAELQMDAQKAKDAKTENGSCQVV